ncbi:YbaB/EbfC DNA-binding family protein [Actinopolymorpha cephalotaxi]|uniref:DNA-binding protein YbaB n=1 Tax=Actinopolymorpha cephalotaxi TaxID=504797 RepID=A0A1I2L8B4_9ACTN|nr:YbaB/EbfC family nucleoid-associated protein [Actinopolymorpha cephalotaxi]NYH85020.1 DNA-binding protein YbaB [Actinopolymorpha cephalotaxi]SFF75602.1 YbaB/EbfC DNA-binding family protein [Actinopolymorpha cephalotaxi]
MTDQPHVTARDFGGVLDIARDAVATHLRAIGQDGAEAEVVSAEGADDDGLVRATVTSEGRIAGVDLSQKAVRLPAEDLSAAVVVAVNRGWDALAATVRENARAQAASSWDPTRFIALQQAAATRTGALIDKLASMNDTAGRISRARRAPNA